MNREIKFRAWNLKYNEWWYNGYSFGFNELSCMEDFPRGCLIADLVFQQYTGLKDKNGKEIYEGDILSHEYYNNVKVIWRGGWSIKGIKCSQRIPKKDKEFKVIGNIYENPELVKEKI